MVDQAEKSYIVRLGEFVLKDYRYAILVTLTLAFLDYYMPILGSVVCVVLGLVVLNKPERESLLLSVIVTILTLFTTYYELQVLPPSAEALKLPMILMSAYGPVATWLGCSILRKYKSFSLVIEGLSILAMVLLLLIYIVNIDIQYELATYINPMLREFANANPTYDTTNLKALLANSLIGIVMLPKMLMAVIYIVLAYKWSSGLVGKPKKTRALLKVVKLSYLFYLTVIVAFLLLTLLNMMSNHPVNAAFVSCANLLPVVTLTCAFGGLSLFYLYLDTTKMKKKQKLIAECFFYFFLYIMPYFLVVLAVLGILGSGTSLRKKLTK